MSSIEKYMLRLNDETGTILPFRLLVMGEFSLACSQEDYEQARPISVDKNNFSSVLSAQQVSCRVQLYNSPFALALAKIVGVPDFSWPIRLLDDFNPERIAQVEPCVSYAERLLFSLIECKRIARPGELIALDQFSAAELKLLAVEEPALNRDQLDFVITDLRFNINQMLNQLIHDKSLQAVESAWRGLYWLVKTADGHPLCKIDMLPVHKDILREDISARTDLVETHFFELLYINEYGQYGGEPYGAVVFDFGFEHSKEDIDFLQQLAQIGRFAHAPIFAAANPSFFGLERFEDIPNIDSLEELQQGARFKYWKKFQESQEAAYVLLTLPKVLMRSSYSFANRNVSSMLYNEDISRLESNCLWGSAAFAFAVNCLESFKKYGTCSELVGPEEGAVNGLEPVRIFEDETIAPVQVLLSERKEAELVRLGFAPLSVIKSQSKLVFYSANSLRWGYCCAQSSSFQDQHLDQVLSAQFPYAFIILRIAQYLKVITRDFVGSTHNISELETLLDNWLRAYVSDVENPPADVRARRPLKKVVLTMSPSTVQPGWYHTEIHITPHTKYLGRYFDLSLDFDVPLKQGAS